MVRIQIYLEGDGGGAQSCPTLCGPMDCSPPGFSIRGIFQARVLEWVAISPGDLPNPGIKPRTPTLQADALPSEPPGNPCIGKLRLKLKKVWEIARPVREIIPKEKKCKK